MKRFIQLLPILLGSVLAAPTDGVADPPQFQVLMITTTQGWHHDAIADAVPAMRGLAKKHHFGLVWEENVDRVFTEKNLRRAYGGRVAFMSQQFEDQERTSF